MTPTSCRRMRSPDETHLPRRGSRQRPEGGDCPGLSQEMQDPKVWALRLGKKVSSREQAGGWLLTGQVPGFAHGAKRLGLVLRWQGAMEGSQQGRHRSDGAQGSLLGNLHTFSLHPCSLRCGAGSPGTFHSTHFHTLHMVLQAPTWEDAKRRKTGSSHSLRNLITRD